MPSLVRLLSSGERSPTARPEEHSRPFSKSLRDSNPAPFGAGVRPGICPVVATDLIDEVSSRSQRRTAENEPSYSPISRPPRPTSPSFGQPGMKASTSTCQPTTWNMPASWRRPGYQSSPFFPANMGARQEPPTNGLKHFLSFVLEQDCCLKQPLVVTGLQSVQQPIRTSHANNVGSVLDLIETVSSLGFPLMEGGKTLSIGHFGP